MTDLATATGAYRAALEAKPARWAEDEPAWLAALRGRSLDRFEDLGWPTTRHEEWRFTNLRDLAATAFLPPNGDGSVTPSCLQLFRLEPACPSLVFVDGKMAAEVSNLDGLPRGLHLLTLAQALERHPEALASRLGSVADDERDALGSLNTALMDGGLFLRVDEGVALERPIQVLHVGSAGEGPRMSHPRNLVIAGAGSRFTLVEDYLSSGDGVTFTNALTEVLVGSGAQVQHFFRGHQRETARQIHHLHVRQERDSFYGSHNLLLGGGLVRQNIRIALAGRGAEARVNGLFVGHGRQHLDANVLVDHAEPHCRSEQLFKGILDEDARGVFGGRIVVRQDAQKTDARQTNRNLLLSERARVDTKPQLEIYADDVKCAHGATTGHIDRDALFYLQTRGLDRSTAMDLLIYGFAHEVLEHMPLAAVRRQAESFLFERFTHVQRIGRGEP